MKHGSICNNCKLFITINSLLIPPPSIWVKSKDYSNLWINLLSKDSAIFLLASLILIHWIVIYPIDNENLHRKKTPAIPHHWINAT